MEKEMIKSIKKTNDIRSTRSFLKSLKRMPIKIQNLFQQKIVYFVSDPYHPSLRTHKLSGTLKGKYSFYLNMSYRVVFKIEGDFIILINIGTHKIYKE